MSDIKQRATKVTNATCPYVTNVHVFWKIFEKEARQVIIVWDGDHPEMIWVKESLNSPICVIDVDEAAKLPNFDKVWVVVQTTLKNETFQDILEILRTKTEDIKVKNTICSATVERQWAVVDLAKQCDIVIIIWWKKSSNSKKLEELSSQFCETYKVEYPEEIDQKWFRQKSIVGISAWASTPDWLIEDVENMINSYC